VNGAVLAATHLRAGRPERALAHVHRSLQTEPEIAISARPFEPAALAQMGRLDEARALVDELRAANPNWNLQLARTVLPPPVIAALVAGLRLAGWESLDG
jgi:Flp pilus assembly protein TadD